MITLLLLGTTLALLVKALVFLVQHARYQAARYQESLAVSTAPEIDPRLPATADFNWTELDERQLARYRAETLQP